MRFILLLCLLLYSTPTFADTITLHKGVNLSNWLANAVRQPLYEKDFIQLEKAGFDNVRLPVNPHQFEAGFDTVDNAINMALAHHLKVVLDLHADKTYTTELETNTQAQATFIALWVNIAKHYRTYAASSLAFELLNEPQFYHAQAGYQALVEKTVAAIREVEKEKTLMIAFPQGSSLKALDRITPLDDPNLIYDFHFYEPYIITHQGVHRGFENKMLRYFEHLPYPADLVDKDAAFYAPTAPDSKQAQQELEEYVKEGWNKEKIASRLQLAKKWADTHHAKLICGEFGVLRNHIDSQSRYRWIQDVRETLESYAIGWQIWDYSDLDGITHLEGETRLDPVDGSLKLVHPEQDNRIMEPEAVKALGLHLPSFPPKYSVSKVIGYIKGKSAIHIARTYRGRNKNFVGESFWARGYFVSTVGRDEALIREYIRNQEKEDIRTEQLKLFRYPTALGGKAERLKTPALLGGT